MSDINCALFRAKYPVICFVIGRSLLNAKFMGARLACLKANFGSGIASVTFGDISTNGYALINNNSYVGLLVSSLNMPEGRSVRYLRMPNHSSMRLRSPFYSRGLVHGCPNADILVINHLSLVVDLLLRTGETVRYCRLLVNRGFTRYANLRFD